MHESLARPRFLAKFFQVALIQLKKRWNISIGAMIYRCSDLGIFSEEQVLNLRRQMSMRKLRTREPLDDILPVESPAVLRKSIDLLSLRSV